MAKQGHPRVGGSDKVAKSARKRTKYSNKLKLDVVDHSAVSGDIQNTITHFFPSLSAAARSTMSKGIYLWRKERHNLAQRCMSAGGGEKRYSIAVFVAISLSRAQVADIVLWINMLRADGVPVSNTMLRERAKAVTIAASVEPFEASWFWRTAFERATKLSIRAKTRHGHNTTAAAADRARASGKEVEAVVEKPNVPTVQNADQTCEFDLLLCDV